MIPCKLFENCPEAGIHIEYFDYSENKVLVKRNHIRLEMNKDKNAVGINDEYQVDLPENIHSFYVNSKNQITVPAKLICEILGLFYGI